MQLLRWITMLSVSAMLFNTLLPSTAAGTPRPKIAGAADSFMVIGLKVGTSYYFALKAVDEANNSALISNVVIRSPVVLAVGDAAFPLAFSTPWPNPALQSAHFSFALPEAAHIEVDAFDITGRRVRSIASGDREAGRGDLTWDLRDGAGRRVEPGVYMVLMTTPGGNWVRRLIVSG